MADIKAGRGIAVHSINGGVVISCTQAQTGKSGSQAEGGDSPTDMYNQSPTKEAQVFVSWDRSPMATASSPVRVKMLTRSYYDKNDDKNYNFYMLLTFSTRGMLLKVEGEFREDAFETTLHEHAI